MNTHPQRQRRPMGLLRPLGRRMKGWLGAKALEAPREGASKKAAGLNCSLVWVAVWPLAAVLVFGTLAATAATRVWEGGPGKNTNDWNRGRNWSGKNTPTAADIAQFDNTANASNLAPNLGSTDNSVGSITFTSGTTNAYDISGSATLTIATGTGISNASATNQTFSVNTVALGANQAWNVGGAGDLTFSSDVSLGSDTLTLQGSGAGTGLISGAMSGTGGLTKTGTGTWVLAGSNTYSGVTSINQGILSVQSSSGLGTTAAGTIVAGTGAALHLDNTSHGDFTTIAEALTLSGTGVGGTGALRNVAGNNTFAGDVTLAGTTRVTANTGSALTLSGDVSGSGQALTIGTVAQGGNVSISDGLDLGAGTLTKVGAGTLALSGATNTVGEVALDGGTISVGAGSTLNTAALESAVSTTLLIGSGGTVVANYASGTTVFSGAIDGTGGGTFEKTGAGALVFDQSFNAGAGSTLVWGGGTLSLLGSQVTFGTIHITGDTILDFNDSAGTFLSSADLIIDEGVSITVNGWAAIANEAINSTVWYATNSINGGVLGGTNQVGGTPLDQIHFTDSGNLTTTWISGNQSGWFDHEIRPTPEPATYGAMFLAACLSLIGWRRFRPRRKA